MFEFLESEKEVTFKTDIWYNAITLFLYINIFHSAILKLGRLE